MENFGFDVLAPVADFLKFADNAHSYGTCIEVTKDTPAQTAHLTPERMEKA